MNEEQVNALIKAYEDEFNRGSEKLINEIKASSPKTESEFDSMADSKISKLDRSMQLFSSEDSMRRNIEPESYFKIVKGMTSSKFSELNLQIEKLKTDMLHG